MKLEKKWQKKEPNRSGKTTKKVKPSLTHKQPKLELKIVTFKDCKIDKSKIV